MARSKLDSITPRQAQFIIDSLNSGQSYRDISAALKVHFDFNLSHSSVKKWAEMNSEKIEDSEVPILQLDTEFVDMFKPKDKSRTVTPFDILRAELLGLYKASLERHKKAGTPINTEYLKQAETLGRIEAKSYIEMTGLGKGTKSAFSEKRDWLDDFPLG